MSKAAEFKAAAHAISGGRPDVMPATFGNAKTKEKSVNTRQLICAANGATAVVTILES